MSAETDSNPIIKLSEALEQKGVPPERLNQILSSGILKDICDGGADLGDRNAIRQALKLDAVSPEASSQVAALNQTFKISVDFSMTLEEMVAAGKYDWKNEDVISKQFSVSGEGRPQFEGKLMKFEESILSEAVVKMMSETSPAGQWEPARIEHLLAFGAQYPQEQLKFPIVALGSLSAGKVFGKRHVPYLYRRVIGRSLHLDWWNTDWNPNYRFLAIRRA